MISWHFSYFFPSSMLSCKIQPFRAALADLCKELAEDTSTFNCHWSIIIKLCSKAGFSPTETFRKKCKRLQRNRRPSATLWLPRLPLSGQHHKIQKLRELLSLLTDVLNSTLACNSKSSWTSCTQAVKGEMLNACHAQNTALCTAPKIRTTTRAHAFKAEGVQFRSQVQAKHSF